MPEQWLLTEEELQKVMENYVAGLMAGVGVEKRLGYFVAQAQLRKVVRVVESEESYCAFCEIKNSVVRPKKSNSEPVNFLLIPIGVWQQLRQEADRE